MANPMHLQIVHAGADATWNWRGGRLDLRDADLSGVRLRGARLDQADLRGARLIGADLAGTRLQEANLAGAHLIRANLDDARIGGGSLAGALLCSASARRATLVRCDLTGANLAGADLEQANLSHGRLAGAILDHTKLVDVEFDGMLGLDAVVHDGPSELGTHALLRFGHQMPSSFLRGVGLPDSFIRYLPAIISSARPVDFYSVYLCAAAADVELARRLHSDLQNAGVRCWFRHTRAETADLDQAIHLHDRSIVVWSAQAQNDPAVRSELPTSTPTGRQTPIVLQTDEAASPGTDQAVVLDFRRWTDFKRYEDSFERLLRALMSSEEDKRQTHDRAS
jgi:uncharacterized protein YjbI with pentapeptide repeats